MDTTKKPEVDPFVAAVRAHMGSPDAASRPSESGQPWTRKDSGMPIDRAFLRDLYDDFERASAAREERLRHYLQWLSVRWAVIWLALFAVLWLASQAVAAYLGGRIR